MGGGSICSVVDGFHVRDHAFFALLFELSARYRISFQLLMVIIYPTIIQPLFNKLSPLAEGELRSRTEALASKLKFPLKHLYEIDGSKRSSHSNAYFFGLPWVRFLLYIFGTALVLIPITRPSTSLFSIPSSNKASLKK